MENAKQEQTAVNRARTEAPADAELTPCRSPDVHGWNLVCSNKPRPSVQKGAKGNQHWRRDVHHVKSVGRLTLCGIDAGEWLSIGPYTAAAADSVHLCKRCKANLA